MDLRNLEGREEFLSRAEAYLEQGLCDEATALARERLERFPGDVDARVIIGSSLARAGKMEEALEILKGVEDDILNWSRAFEYLGDIYRDKGLTEKATEDYQKFISLNVASPVAEDVSAKLDSLITDTVPDEEGGIEDVSPAFHTITLAELYMKQGHSEMAREVLNEILKADAGNIKAVEMLKDIDAILSAVSYTHLR
ncbi:MAG: tetratricopeptide repeat protein, partial [Proteobacteria bacterium]|nr:tetratricopeptide repeat protein [Pseudomonadota bacterium]